MTLEGTSCPCQPLMEKQILVKPSGQGATNQMPGSERKLRDGISVLGRTRHVCKGIQQGDTEQLWPRVAEQLQPERRKQEQQQKGHKGFWRSSRGVVETLPTGNAMAADGSIWPLKIRYGRLDFEQMHYAVHQAPDWEANIIRTHKVANRWLEYTW